MLHQEMGLRLKRGAQCGRKVGADPRGTSKLRAHADDFVGLIAGTVQKGSNSFRSSRARSMSAYHSISRSRG